MVHVAVVIIQQVEFQFLGPGCTIVEGQPHRDCLFHLYRGAEPAVGSVAVEIPELNVLVSIFRNKPDAARRWASSSSIGVEEENGGKVHPAGREPVGRSADLGDSATSG